MYFAGMSDEMEALKKELAAAKLENDELRIRLNNLMMMLKKEMHASGSLPALTAPKK